MPASRAERGSALHVADVGPTVLGPRGFVVAFGLGPLRAVAHRLDLAGLGAHQLELLGDDLRALVAERQVVLARAALVGIAFDADLRLRVRADVLAVAWISGRYLLSTLKSSNAK